MLNSFYDRLILYPRLTIIFVLLVVGLLSSQAVKVEIDASSETLLLKDDKDLAFTREINQRYTNPEFLSIDCRDGVDSYFCVVVWVWIHHDII